MTSTTAVIGAADLGGERFGTARRPARFDEALAPILGLWLPSAARRTLI